MSQEEQYWLSDDLDDLEEVTELVGNDADRRATESVRDCQVHTGQDFAYTSANGGDDQERRRAVLHDPPGLRHRGQQQRCRGPPPVRAVHSCWSVVSDAHALIVIMIMIMMTLVGH